MATTYTIDGSTASIAPFGVQWVREPIGQDHNGAPLYPQKYNVILSFPESEPAWAKEWLDLADGASHTIDVLNRSQTSFKTLSPVWVSIDQYPPQEDIHTGPFILRIVGADD